MGSLTCAHIWVRAVHGEGQFFCPSESTLVQTCLCSPTPLRRAQTSLHKSWLGGTLKKTPDPHPVQPRYRTQGVFGLAFRRSTLSYVDPTTTCGAYIHLLHAEYRAYHRSSSSSSSSSAFLHRRGSVRDSISSLFDQIESQWSGHKCALIATITGGLRLRRSEVLRSLKHNAGTKPRT